MGVFISLYFVRGVFNGVLFVAGAAVAVVYWPSQDFGPEERSRFLFFYCLRDVRSGHALRTHAQGVEAHRRGTEKQTEAFLDIVA